MKFSILSQQTVIGVLPYSELLSGSADLGDVLNSWVTFTNKALVSLPTHPLAILNKSIPTIVATAASLADTFKLEVSPVAIDHDGVITFKGVEYYVTDYETEDLHRSRVTLSCTRKDVLDAQQAEETADVIQLDTLDLLFTFVTGQLDTALQNAAFSKQHKQPVGVVAAPARGKAWTTLPYVPDGGLAKSTLVTHSAKTAGNVSKASCANIDVAAAQAALSALLQKGSL